MPVVLMLYVREGTRAVVLPEEFLKDVVQPKGFLVILYI